MSDLPQPPYPADTRAKGWRFELDYEQIDQSETWPIAAEIPMGQHALLMMWFVAWSKQKPCGSFPNDENSIRAACRIPPGVWSKCSDVLMRGWWLADDGRLYHDTIVKRVLEMMSKRRSDSDRQAAKRAREAADSARVAKEKGVNHSGVTRDTEVTPAGVGAESSTDHRPPTTEYSEAIASGGPKPPDEMTKDELWKAGKSLLADGGIPGAQCGSFMGKLVKDYKNFPDVVVESVRIAVLERPADPASFLKATCQRLAGERKAPNKQEAIEASNKAAGARWLVEQGVTQ